MNWKCAPHKRADGLLQQVEAHLVHFTALRTLEAEALRRWVGILRKLVSDEFVIERDATGAAVAVRHCTPKERGSFVLGSTVDPEATFRKHGEKNDLGYNVQVGATDKFIREIFAEHRGHQRFKRCRATGGQPDRTNRAGAAQADL